LLHFFKSGFKRLIYIIMTEIIDFTDSPKPLKRFRITLDISGKEKHFDFGSKGGRTFIDEGNVVKRTNFLKRHLANRLERERVENLIPSPALFSIMLLWGDSTDLTDNIVHLNKLFKSTF